MLQRDFADDFVTGVHGAADAVLAGFHVGRLQQQPGRRRCAEVEGEGAIGPNSDTRRDGNAGVDVGGTSIELLSKARQDKTVRMLIVPARSRELAPNARGSTHLAKVHTLHTFTTQGRTDRRTGAGLASAHNELDDLVLGQCLLRHGGMRSRDGS